MRGPYRLEMIRVDMTIPSGVGGVYCLAHNTDTVEYVDRADKGLRDALKSHASEYQYYWYDVGLSARETYVCHCEAFHKHAGSLGIGKNEHPKPPASLEMKCPVCGQ